jgi:L-fucose isomerase-like protein
MLEENMLTVKVGFVVYGVHKVGLLDPSGDLFIDERIIEQSKQALIDRGVVLEVHDVVVAEKAEAIQALSKMKKDDSIATVILFSGTWVWSSNMLSAIRDFATSGKGIVVWTHPGSQGWRPVGGLVLHSALMEIGIKHRFVYGEADNAKEMDKIVSYCKASTMVQALNLSTVCSFGGRGMGQNCGVADPSQWTKTFGIDIDSRDTTQLIQTAKDCTDKEVEAFRLSLGKWFHSLPEDNQETSRSIRLYLAMRKLREQIGFDFYTVQSFPGLGDDYSATCLMQSMMLEEGQATSTLSDFNTLMTVILLNWLSTERIYYGDLQHINKHENEIKIIGDGTIAPSLAGKISGYKASFASHGIPTEGAAGGLAVSLVAKEGRGAVAMLGRVNGKFQLVAARCSIFEPKPEQVEARRRECGIPFWPHAFIKVDGDIEALIQNWSSEYACLGYGEDLCAVLADFCELVGIEFILV